ncbi:MULTISPECIES: hypothetical protein [unclassified Streptomyces]|uniref:hypothetical protein n=1 Tax=unclassified Streptomyces TaxID=2593676 RepID=UPI002E2E327F|nr:hypothetical protein [Streptomyces sp. NBC_00441]
MAHSAPASYGLGCVLVDFGAMAVLVGLGVPSVACVMSLLLLGVVLIIGVPYGFRSAVLDSRGERTPGGLSARCPGLPGEGPALTARRTRCPPGP